MWPTFAVEGLHNNLSGQNRGATRREHAKLKRQSKFHVAGASDAPFSHLHRQFCSMAAEKPLDHIAYRLLLRAHPPEIASSIFNEKLLHKPLVLRPTSPDPNSQDARALRRRQRLRKKEHIRRRQKPKPLSAKEKRMLGVYDIPKEAQKYDLYLPLHRLWLEYMQEILGLREGEQGYVTAQSAGSKLASADYHGALLEVVRSKCVERVGCQGIVLKDTKFTFEVITVKNVLRSTFLAKTKLRLRY